MAAAGSVGLLTYTYADQDPLKNHNVRRKPHLSEPHKSPNVAVCNARFKVASDAWLQIPQTERDWWTQHGLRVGKPARTLFIGEFLIQRCSVGDIPRQPWNYEGGAF